MNPTLPQSREPQCVLCDLSLPVDRLGFIVCSRHMDEMVRMGWSATRAYQEAIARRDAQRPPAPDHDEWLATLARYCQEHQANE